MPRRGKGVCPRCRRKLTISVGGYMLRHNRPGTSSKCEGQGQEALPTDHGFEIEEVPCD